MNAETKISTKVTGLETLSCYAGWRNTISRS
jgi:hypothetical protein